MIERQTSVCAEFQQVSRTLVEYCKFRLLIYTRYWDSRHPHARWSHTFIKLKQPILQFTDIEHILL